jgi:uncharacterized protein YbjT (DUF2867 family)
MSLMKKTGKALADVIPGLGHFVYDTTVGTVFITSGTGVVGYRVATSLLEAGHKDVRVGIWKGDREHDDQSFGQQCADALKAKGAEVIDFDWTSEADYETALKGVKTVFCSLPHVEGWSDVFPAFIKVCKQKKVEHFVKISFLRPTHDWKGVSTAARQYRESVPFVSFHGVCDDLLEASKNDSRISYTILCCSHLMSTPLIMQGKLLREDHKFVTASYGMGVNYVSPNDVADAAVVCILNNKAHRNKVYNLTGPGPITDQAVAKLLTKHYGTNVEHVEMGYHAYKEDARKRGLPEWQVKDAAAFERMKASGIDELSQSYTKDIEKITGMKPESFADYLNNKSCMRPGMTFP